MSRDIQQYLSPLFQIIFLVSSEVESIQKPLNKCWMNERKKEKRSESKGHSNLLVSQQGLCYSIWLSPSQGSQTLPRIPDHPTLGADWYAPHEVSSNPQCPLFLLPPSHCLLSEQAVQGEMEKWEQMKKLKSHRISRKPKPEVSQLSLETEHQSARLGNSGLYTVASSSIKWSMENHSDIILSQKTKLLPTLFSQMGMEESKNFFFF